jgi:hypothetical protein
MITVGPVQVITPIVSLDSARSVIDLGCQSLKRQQRSIA